MYAVNALYDGAGNVKIDPTAVLVNTPYKVIVTFVESAQELGGTSSGVEKKWRHWLNWKNLRSGCQRILTIKKNVMPILRNGMKIICALIDINIVIDDMVKREPFAKLSHDILALCKVG
jgi:hypothetical protein